MYNPMLYLDMIIESYLTSAPLAINGAAWALPVPVSAPWEAHSLSGLIPKLRERVPGMAL
jgi:hypothetical protein